MNISEIYPSDYQEAVPQHFDPRNEFGQRREYRKYFGTPIDIRYDHHPRYNPDRVKNPAYNPYDSNNDPYPQNLTSRIYRAGAKSPHVTFDPILGSAPLDHGYGLENLPYSRRGPPSPSPATAYDTMGMWNLRFSGARDEDPKDYLLRLVEVPVGVRPTPASPSIAVREIPTTKSPRSTQTPTTP